MVSVRNYRRSVVVMKYSPPESGGVAERSKNVRSARAGRSVQSREATAQIFAKRSLGAAARDFEQTAPSARRSGNLCCAQPPRLTQAGTSIDLDSTALLRRDCRRLIRDLNCETQY